jgi:hypothetical protein
VHADGGDSFGAWSRIRPSTHSLGFVEDLRAEQVEQAHGIRQSVAMRRARLTAIHLVAVAHADQGVVWLIPQRGERPSTCRCSMLRDKIGNDVLD